MFLFSWWLRAALLPLLLAISAGYAFTLFNEYRRRERREPRKRAFDFFKDNDFLNSSVLNNPVGERVKEMYDYLSGRNGNGERHDVPVERQSAAGEFKKAKTTKMKDVDTTAKEAPSAKAADANPEKFPEAEKKKSK